MSRQDKATTDRHAKILRELVKRPENKVCADCKRNDPRWASWNLGLFLCIRCSGIHRSMGTHISKVKSVDLDIWTPEQMQCIVKWGNRLANLYWEAHLKPGHIPPEHKIESFIRSKYESRRWAMEGPIPTDPTTLETATQPVEAPMPVSAPTPPPQQQQPAAVSVTRQPQPHQLLSTKHANQAPTVQAPPVQTPSQPAAPQQPANDLFSLDFHSPAPTSAPTTQNPAKGKQDIMSLFSAAPTTASPAPNVWGQPAQPQQPPQPQTTSMMGNAGAGMWGASSGWGAPQAQPQQAGFGNLWGSQPAPTAAPDPFGNVWGSTNTTTPGTSDLFASSSTTQKKDDVFGDLWGGFK